MMVSCFFFFFTLRNKIDKKLLSCLTVIGTVVSVLQHLNQNNSLETSSPPQHSARALVLVAFLCLVPTPTTSFQPEAWLRTMPFKPWVSTVCNVQALFPDKDYDLALPHSSNTDALSLTKGSVPSKPRPDGTKTDKMEESLTCVICQDLLHDCVRWEVWVVFASIRKQNASLVWLYFPVCFFPLL